MAERRTMLVAELDAEELAVRMCEASYGLKRPMPSAKEALAAMDRDCREGWHRAAVAAFNYFRECMENARCGS